MLAVLPVSVLISRLCSVKQSSAVWGMQLWRQCCMLLWIYLLFCPAPVGRNAFRRFHGDIRQNFCVPVPVGSSGVSETDRQGRIIIGGVAVLRSTGCLQLLSKHLLAPCAGIWGKAGTPLTSTYFWESCNPPDCPSRWDRVRLGPWWSRRKRPMAGSWISSPMVRVDLGIAAFSPEPLLG